MAQRCVCFRGVSVSYLIDTLNELNSVVNSCDADMVVLTEKWLSGKALLRGSYSTGGKPWTCSFRSACHRAKGRTALILCTAGAVQSVFPARVVHVNERIFCFYLVISVFWKGVHAKFATSDRRNGSVASNTLI